MNLKSSVGGIMSDLLISPSVSLVNGRPSVTSLQIAEHFGKRHDSVLRDIRRIIASCPKDFTDHNFVASEYTDETGRTLLMFLIYRDGFMLLVMGYTGKKALQIKLAYIAAFNAMEAELAGKPQPPALPAATTRSTADDRKPLRSLVFAWSQSAGIHVSALWPQVKAHFQLERIDDLPVEWVPDALAFVQGKIDALQKALPAEQKRSAPPAALDPSYSEKCAEVTAKVISLRTQLFLVSRDMMETFRSPFWGKPGDVPEDKKPFADAMNFAIQSFLMAVNKDLEATELLFKAYVEGEKLLRS